MKIENTIRVFLELEESKKSKDDKNQSLFTVIENKLNISKNNYIYRIWWCVTQALTLDIFV